MCAFSTKNFARLCFHDCVEAARPVSPNVRGHHGERPKPILTPWNPTRKPILCDCMIIRVGLAACLCKRGLFIHGGFSSCAKAPSDLNSSIIRQAAKASFRLQTQEASHSAKWVGDPKKIHWIVINLHTQRHAVQWEILGEKGRSLCPLVLRNPWMSILGSTWVQFAPPYNEERGVSTDLRSELLACYATAKLKWPHSWVIVLHEGPCVCKASLRAGKPLWLRAPNEQFEPGRA